MERAGVTLPPGQRLIRRFPRFGTDISGPPPSVPADPVLDIRGAGADSFQVPLTELATLPQRELIADFHCVAGWSATSLRWEGVAFATAYRMFIEPALSAETTVTHLVFRGLDGFRSVLAIDDALAEDVLLADRLDGRPLNSEHGAPLRLVSPKQYGYMSTKHLCRIDVKTAEPRGIHRSVLRLLSPHPRARVWQEERHRYLPAWSVRRVYRATIAYILVRGRRPGT